MLVDWRGVPDLSRPVEAYSIASTHERRPVTGNPSGKVLVAVSPTVMMKDGVPVNRPYNMALWRKVVDLGASTNRVVWQGENGYETRLFDLTKRGMLREWIKILDSFFPWADGFHLDYFSAWSWAFPDMASSDEAWDKALTDLANALRSRGKLVLGQQFHLTQPLLACNGAFVEQSPFAWHYTLPMHTEDMDFWFEFTNRVDPRTPFWVYEIRDYLSWPKETLDLVKAWAEKEDVLLALGRK